MDRILLLPIFGIILITILSSASCSSDFCEIGSFFYGLIAISIWITIWNLLLAKATSKNFIPSDTTNTFKKASRMFVIGIALIMLLLWALS